MNKLNAALRFAIVICGTALFIRGARGQEPEPPVASTTDLPEHALLRIEGKPAQGKMFCAMVAFSPDGKTLALTQDAVIWLWDIAEQKATRSLQGHTEPVMSLCFSADGATLISSSMDTTVRVWNVAQGKERLKVQCGNFDALDIAAPAAAITPDGKKLACSKGDKSVQVFNLAKVFFSAKEHQKDKLGVISLAFSPDGKTLASASDRLMLWNAETGERLHTFDDYFFPVAFAPNGKVALSSGRQKNGTDEPTRCLKVWDVATKKELHALTGFKGLIYNVAFAPDGKLIAAACVDKKVHLWHAETGKPAATLEGHMEQVVSVSFSPDGKMLASSDAGEKAEKRGTVLLWKVPKKD